MSHEGRVKSPTHVTGKPIMMMTKRRHVSRWQPVGSATQENESEQQLEEAAAGRPHMSLRYLNEFVGKVQCASDLLHHELFPDAKEITESMGLFNAVRRYLLHDEQTDTDAAHQQQPATRKSDGIVVVGDGNTPRSAALFAYRMRQWKSYSIDPAMEKNSTERSIGWESISNLVVIRNKIENVRITLRRAIVVLMHAHVTLEQALSAVDAESIVGVVTIPCCNWYGDQEKLFGRHPDLVYDDFSILSDHREIRLWIGGNEATQSPTPFKDHEDFAALAKETKGCVRKEFVSDEPCTSSSDVVNVETEGKKAGRMQSTNALVFFHELLQQVPTLDAPQEIEQLSSQILEHLPVESHALVFGAYTHQPLERKLLRAGYDNLYTLANPSMSEGVLTVQVNKLQALSDSRDDLAQTPFGQLQIIQTPSGYDVSFAPLSTSDSLPLDCVVDYEWLFRGFRQHSKNAQLFQSVCLLLQQIVATFQSSAPASSAPTCSIASFICVTQRKNWRKKEYLAHDALDFAIQTLAIQSAGPSVGDQAKNQQHRQLYAYICHKHSASVRSGHASEQQMSTKDHVLFMKRLMDIEFNSRKRSLGTMPIESITIAFAATLQHQEVDDSANAVDNMLTEGMHMQLSGEITRIRRYTNGVCFLSLGNPGDALMTNTVANAQQKTMQVLLQLSVLEWTSEYSDRVLGVLHRGDEVRVLGYMGTTDKGKPILYAIALKLVRGEYEAFD